MQPPPAAAEQQELAQPSVDIFLTHVPANLRAKFGRARCRELLADEAAVQQTWSRLLSESGGSSSSSAEVGVGSNNNNGYHGNRDQLDRQPQRRPPQRLPPLRQQQQQQQPVDYYAILSEQFNSDYSPGVAATRQLGHNHETHGEAQFQSSDLFNYAGGQHKRRRDEFATYNEIIHVERKFNHHWALEAAGAGSNKPLPRQPRQPQQQQHQAPAASTTQPPPSSSSILMRNGKSEGSSTSAKRVTISGDQHQQDAGQSLHRANTVQRVA